jgi:hypothetical protein
MKLTIGIYDLADMLTNDAPKAWTRVGALELAKWFEEIENDTGDQIEIDLIGIRVSYSEYDSVLEAASEYGWEADASEYAEQHEAAARQFLEARTEIRLFSGGVLVLNF